jgi:hypothetical protein
MEGHLGVNGNPGRGMGPRQALLALGSQHALRFPLAIKAKDKNANG